MYVSRSMEPRALRKHGASDQWQDLQPEPALAFTRRLADNAGGRTRLC